MHTSSIILLLLIGYAAANTNLCNTTGTIIINKGDGCINSCRCTDGTIICTELCFSKDVPSASQEQSGESSLCKPNGSKIVPLGDECNNVCFCSNGEVKSCTNFICKPAGYYRTKREVSDLPDCKAHAGKTLPLGDNCNICYCNEDGTLNRCTLRSCHQVE